MGAVRYCDCRTASLSMGQRKAIASRSGGYLMTARRWPSVSYLDAIRPDYGWRTELGLLASYSADLVAVTAALLALAGVDDDRGSGGKVDFANAVNVVCTDLHVHVADMRSTASYSAKSISPEPCCRRR